MVRSSSIHRFIAAAVLILFACAPADAQEDQPPVPVNLETPQACVETFLLSARHEDFEQAAKALNFRLFDRHHPGIDHATAAERLYFVLNQELWMDWDTLPDRPDGMIDEATVGGSNPMVGEERVNILLGSIGVEDGRDLPIRVQRITNDSGERVWLFSANTVANIPALYESHGPSWLSRQMPDWATQQGWGGVALWKWVVLGLTLMLAPVIAYWTATLIKRSVHRINTINMELLEQFDWPLSATIATLILYLVVEFVLSLPGTIATFVDPLVLVIFIGCLTWLLMRILSVVMDRVARNALLSFHEEGSDERRKVLTQVIVARYTVLLLTVCVALGFVLFQLDVAKTLGVTLLSSAGAAAVVFGIAGHAVLGNLIAGLQIALSQPFKIGDTVMVEDQWSTIEDINYTHVVIKTWDKRRCVFPIKYFTNEWFENWSLTDPFLQKPIYLYLDYRAPVEKIREKFLELIKANELWDQEQDEPTILVTDLSDETMTVRLTAGGKDSSDAWNLSCQVREQLVQWLQQLDNGRYLPRQRVLLSDLRDDPDEDE